MRPILKEMYTFPAVQTSSPFRPHICYNYNSDFSQKANFRKVFRYRPKCNLYGEARMTTTTGSLSWTLKHLLFVIVFIERPHSIWWKLIILRNNRKLYLFDEKYSTATSSAGIDWRHVGNIHKVTKKNLILQITRTNN